MSYASVAGSGPEQTFEEKRAPAPPEIENKEPVAQVSSVDVDITPVHTVPTEFKFQSVDAKTQENYLHEEHQSDEIQAKVTEEKHEKAAQSCEKKSIAKRGKSNNHVNGNDKDHIPVFNIVAVIALCSGLSFGLYRTYIAGQLNWKVLGIWTGIAGAFAIANFNLTLFFESAFRTEE